MPPKSSQRISHSTSVQPEFSSTFLWTLFINAVSNATKGPYGSHHDSVVIKFSTSLFIWVGSVAYEFLHKNMSEALPSISVVRKKVHT